MKTINVTFEDKEHKKLIEKKRDLSWHDFILKLTDKNKEIKNKNGVEI